MFSFQVLRRFRVGKQRGRLSRCASSVMILAAKLSDGLNIHKPKRDRDIFYPRFCGALGVPLNARQSY